MLDMILQQMHTIALLYAIWKVSILVQFKVITIDTIYWFVHCVRIAQRK